MFFLAEKKINAKGKNVGLVVLRYLK